ncbi:MAG: hypothetical protein WCO57_14600, partial [Verrucomicrobiota bacterium]
ACLPDVSIANFHLESDSSPKVSTEPVAVNAASFHGKITVPGLKSKEGAKLGADRWKLIVNCTGTASNEPCHFYFTVSPCSACKSCDATSASASAKQGCFIGYIPLGASDAGDTTGFLRFYTPDLTNPGTAGIIALVPSTFTVNRDGTGRITSVVGSVNTITLTSSATAFDPNAFTLTLKHNGTGATFRTTTISRIQQSDTTYLCLDSTYDNSTYRYRQSQPIPNKFVLDSGTFVNGTISSMRTQTRTISVPVPGKEVHRDTVKENNIPVSDIETTWENFAWGWEKTQEIIDPSGTPLTSNWAYFQPGESTTVGYGLLKRYTRYDGYEEVHSYQFNGGSDSHMVQLPFAGNLQGLTNTLTWNSNTSTSTINRTVNGKTLSEESVAFIEASNTIKAVTKASSDASLTETITFIPYGSYFGGQPSNIEHADGTNTAYTYAYQRTGGIITAKTLTDSTTGSDSRGRFTTTNYNRSGNIIRQITNTVGYPSNITTDHLAVTAVDALGRPTNTAYFPSNSAVAGEQASATSPKWTTATTYSCCGISSFTDRHGVTTSYGYDGLRRQNKATTLGVTTETVYNGLTTDSHRYIGAGTANNGNRISSRTRNLAGIETSSSSPNPSSATAGVLVATTSATTYAGGLTTTVTTTSDGSQSTTTYSDGRIASSIGNLQPQMTYGYGVNDIGLVTSSAYQGGFELTTTQADWAGHTTNTTKGTESINYAYNSSGQLKSVTDANDVRTLYAYNSLGERTTTARKLDSAATITFGTDQISRTETLPALRSDNTEVLRTSTQVWKDQATEANGTCVSYTDRTPDGLSSWSWRIGVANLVSRITASNTWDETATNPDSTYSVTTINADGLPEFLKQYSSGATLIAQIHYTYDTLKRPSTSTDSRTGTTTTAYVSDTVDLVASVIPPAGDSQKTSYAYDSRGNRTQVNAPDTKDATGANLPNVTNTSYDSHGRMETVTGDQAYPVSYTYDYAGRMKTMTTTGSAGNATTTWIYSQTTGRLEQKLDATDKGPSYTYTLAGRLETRTWARNVSPTNNNTVTTTYGYTHGLLTSVSYNDDTPNITYTYDTLGRQKTASNGIAQSLFDYADSAETGGDLRIDKETITYSLPGQVAFTRVLDRAARSLGRNMGFTLGIVGDTDSEQTVSYGYSAVTGQFESVGNGTDIFTYGYTYTQSGTGPRVGAISGTGLKPDFIPYTLTKNGSPTLRTLRTYEASRDVLTAVSNDVLTPNNGEFDIVTRSLYDYSIVNGGVNNIGQRGGVRTTFDLGGPVSNPGDTSWKYDSLGQLVSADAPVITDEFTDRAYTFDTIGNRKESATGTWSLNSEQQPVFTSEVATSYFGSVTNGTPSSPGANKLNQYAAITTGTNTVPTTHDFDGNLTTGPLPSAPAASSILVWDAENRLVEAKTDSNTTIEINHYDAQARRIACTAGGVTTLFIYDGFNCIAEYTRGTTGSPALSKTRLWGLDLSGSLQGAGGVGGLLAETHGADTFYPTFDGNGNVSEYLTGAGGVAAHFEYDPFGNTLVVSEASAGLAATFAYRFSTKPLDFLTGLYYYG